MEEKRSMVIGVIRCFRFREKRGRGSTRFERGNEHAWWLLVPAQRGNHRMAVCGDDRQSESGGV
jgi:hypothetical protein